MALLGVDMATPYIGESRLQVSPKMLSALGKGVARTAVMTQKN
jgi:hypothetical protein